AARASRRASCRSRSETPTCPWSRRPGRRRGVREAPRRLRRPLLLPAVARVTSIACVSKHKPPVPLPRTEPPRGAEKQGSQLLCFETQGGLGPGTLARLNDVAARSVIV